MKLTMTAANEQKSEVYVDAYKFEGGYLVLSNPRDTETSKPDHDGVLISCSEIKLIIVDK